MLFDLTPELCFAKPPEKRVYNLSMTFETSSRPNRSLGMLLIGAGIMLIAAMLALLTKSPGATGIPKPGERLADFTLPAFGGGKGSLSDYAGRPVLINAWGSWCPPCRAEMPDSVFSRRTLSSVRSRLCYPSNHPRREL